MRKVTLNLIDKADADVAWLSADLDMTQTDVINRAVQLYAFVQREIAAGKRLKVGYDGGPNEIVHLA